MPASFHAILRIVCMQEDNEEIRMFAAAKRKMMKMRMDKEQQLQRCVHVASYVFSRFTLTFVCTGNFIRKDDNVSRVAA